MKRRNVTNEKDIQQKPIDKVLKIYNGQNIDENNLVKNSWPDAIKE